MFAAKHVAGYFPSYFWEEVCRRAGEPLQLDKVIF
jgi:hypothetical protein